MERVSVIHGKNPVILVAPHGFDDSNTDVMTEAAAAACGGHAVINRGWMRNDNVDPLKDLGNCNSIKHCKTPVIQDEFYNPLIKMATRILSKNPKVYVFHIHGCGNDLRKKAGCNLDVVLGWGAGDKPRPCCGERERDLFCYLVQNFKDSETSKQWLPAQAGPGSQYAAWNYDNLLQIWRKINNAHAIQLEFITDTRKKKDGAKSSGTFLGKLIKGFVRIDSTGDSAPPDYSYLRLNI